MWEGDGGFCARRCSALTQRGVGAHYKIVNCAPAKGCVWPVAAPARAWVRAGVWRRGAAFLLRRFASDHACCLTLSAKQDGLRQVSFLFREGRDRRLHVLMALRGYRACWVYLGLVRFLVAIPTRERSRRRGVGALLRKHIGLAMFSAGSPLGLRAKETLSPWTLFI